MEKEKDVKAVKKEAKPKVNKDKEKILKLEEEVKEYKDKYLRTLAESENFKKRMLQEKDSDRKYANMNFAYQLLTPFDQLDQIVNLPTDNELLNNYLIGFKMIRNQFNEVFKEVGIEEIEALNQTFNPNFHDALEKTNHEDKENGIITEVIQKGYKFKERILRPAKVKVNEWREENGEDK